MEVLKKQVGDTQERKSEVEENIEIEFESENKSEYFHLFLNQIILIKSANNYIEVIYKQDEKVSRLRIQLEIVSNLSKLTGLTADKIDVVFFDQEEVDPDILRNAINHGILLKNIAPELLSDRIGELSKYFLRNEPTILNAKRLEKERLEAFCEVGE